MLNEKLGISNISEELLVAIYKSMEIYDTIKYTRLKINNKVINTNDKKYLSLLLGIYFKKNSVSKILNLLRYDYGIYVYTDRKKEEEYVDIYINNFKEIVEPMLNEETNTIEEFMLKLIEVDFIKWIHNSNSMSLVPIKILLDKMIKEEEIPKLYKKNKM